MITSRGRVYENGLSQRNRIFFFFNFGIEDWNGNGFEKEVIQFLKFRSNQLLVFYVLVIMFIVLF